MFPVNSAHERKACLENQRNSISSFPHTQMHKNSNNERPFSLSQTLSGTKHLVGGGYWEGEYLTLGFERAQAIRQGLAGPGKLPGANARAVFDCVPQYHAVS